MKNRLFGRTSGAIVLGAMLIVLSGVLVLSANAKYSYGMSVDGVSSATSVATPTLSSVTSTGYESLKLTWTSVSGANYYEVYRATSATGTFSKVAQVSGTHFTNTGRVTGKYYYYKVRAAVVSGTSTYKGKYSSVKNGKAIPSTPAISLTAASRTSIKVSWGGISGATKYLVYRATSSTGTYSLVKTASPTTRSWVNVSLKTGKTYYYKVRVYHLEGTTKVYSKYSAVKSMKR